MNCKQTPLKRLLSYMTKYRVKFTLAISLMVVYAISSALIPVLMGVATDVITAKDLSGLEVVFYQFLTVTAILFFVVAWGSDCLLM